MTIPQRQISERRVAVARRRIGPAQILAGILGLIMLIYGGVGAARLGFDSLTANTTTLAGLRVTLLTALIFLAIGLLFLGGASNRYAARGTMLSLGALTLAFGVVVLIEPSPFMDPMGAGRRMGLVFAVLGMVALLAGMFSPSAVVTESVTDDVVRDDRLL